MVELQMLEPFSVVKYMFCNAGIHVDGEQVKNFWRHHRTVASPWAVASDATEAHIPLGLFGDAAKVRQLSYNLPEKYLGIFINAPLWRPRSCRSARWLVFAIKEDQLYKHYTLNAVYRRLVWSLNLLHSGLYPECGPDGEPLTGAEKERAGKQIANGLVFSVTEVRADWLYHKQALRLTSSWKAGSKSPVCFLCPAVLRGQDRYTDLDSSTSAIWCKEYTLSQFLTQQLHHEGGPSN